FGLRAGAGRRFAAEELAVDGHADERDDFGSRALDLAAELAVAARRLVARQLARAPRRPWAHVGQREPPLAQPCIGFGSDRLRHAAWCRQQTRKQNYHAT